MTSGADIETSDQSGGHGQQRTDVSTTDHQATIAVKTGDTDTTAEDPDHKESGKSTTGCMNRSQSGKHRPIGAGLRLFPRTNTSPGVEGSTSLRRPAAADSLAGQATRTAMADLSAAPNETDQGTSTAAMDTSGQRKRSTTRRLNSSLSKICCPWTKSGHESS